MSYYDDLYMEIHGTLPDAMAGYGDSDMEVVKNKHISLPNELMEFYLSLGRSVENKYFTLYEPGRIKEKNGLYIFAEGYLTESKSEYGIEVESGSPDAPIYEVSFDTESGGIYLTGNTLRSFLAGFVVVDASTKFDKTGEDLELHLEENTNIPSALSKWSRFEISNKAQTAYVLSGKIIQVIWDNEIGGSGFGFASARNKEEFAELKGLMSHLGLL